MNTPPPKKLDVANSERKAKLNSQYDSDFVHIWEIEKPLTKALKKTICE